MNISGGKNGVKTEYLKKKTAKIAIYIFFSNGKNEGASFVIQQIKKCSPIKG